MHEHSNGPNITLNVTDEHLGVWVPKTDNAFEFNLAIVDLAREHHFEMNHEVWEADKPMFLNGHATFDMVQDLGFITDMAVLYLNGILPENYFFDIDEGLQLFRNE